MSGSDRITQDYQNLSMLMDEVVGIATQFHRKLPEHPVGTPDTTMAKQPLADDGIGGAAALERFEAEIAPYLSGSIGPRYLGYVTGGATPAAMMGDWLAAAVDQNTASPGDSIAAALTHRTIAMLCALFDLPDSGAENGFDGTFTTGAQGANTLASLCFRQWAGRRQGVNPDREGIAALNGVEIFAASPHSTMLKSLGLTGFGRNAYRQVATLEGREAMDVVDLQRCLEQSEAAHKIVIASAGIVSTGDSENLSAIADLCDRYDCWLHVDGAFGLYARLLPDYRDQVAGVERADSITTDCHKWLNVPYDSGLFLTRHLDLLEEALGLTAAYLKTDDPAPSYINRSLESSQRFRALPVWMSLVAYGRNGIAAMIENSCKRAKALGERIDQMDGFECLAPVRLNIVLFRAVSGDIETSNRDQKAIMEAINRTGKVFVTPGLFEGKSGMRAAFSNWMTDEADVETISDGLKAGLEAFRAGEI